MTDVAQKAVEQTIRDLISENPDLPIRAEFYRGPNPNRYASPFAEPSLREYVSTPSCPGEWFVKVLPTLVDGCVSGAGRSSLGVNDVIGEVTAVLLPQSSPGVTDVDAASGSRLHVELLAAIRDKAAVVEQMRANITA